MKKESLIMLSLLFTTAAVALTFTTTVPKVTPTVAAPPEGVVAVDLALPGGTKWANMNVGAEKPEDFGLYFAWGETDGYEYDTVAYHPSDSFVGYKFGGYGYLKKYCYHNSEGNKDKKIKLDPEDDAAHVYWGGSWRMPTRREFELLWEETKHEFTAQNGVFGIRFTSKKNGNSIFLPATVGDCNNEMVNYFAKPQRCGYWSSTLHYEAIGCLKAFALQDCVCTKYRHCKLSIRPVLKETK